MRLIEHFVKSLRVWAIFIPGIQVTPSGIVLPDKDHRVLLDAKRTDRFKQVKA